MISFIKLHIKEIFDIFILIGAISLFTFSVIIVIEGIKKLYFITLHWLKILIMKIATKIGFYEKKRLIFILFSFFHYLIALTLEKKGKLSIKWKNGFIAFDEYDIYNSSIVVTSRWYFKLLYLLLYSNRFSRTNDMFVDWVIWINNKITDRSNPEYIPHYIFLWGYLFKHIYICLTYIYLLYQTKMVKILKYFKNSQMFSSITIYIYILKNNIKIYILNKYSILIWDLFINSRLQFYYLTPHFILYHIWTKLTKGKYWAKWYSLDNLDEYNTPRWIFLPDIKDNIIRHFIDLLSWTKQEYSQYNNTGLNFNPILSFIYLLYTILFLFLTKLMTLFTIIKNSLIRLIFWKQYDLLSSFKINGPFRNNIKRLIKFLNKAWIKLLNINGTLYFSIIPYMMFLFILWIYKNIVIYSPLIIAKFLSFIIWILNTIRWTIPLIIIYTAFSIDLLEFFSIFTLEWILRDFMDIFISTYAITGTRGIDLHNPYWWIRWYSHRWWGRAGIVTMQRRGYFPVLYALDSKLYEFVVNLHNSEKNYRHFISANMTRVDVMEYAKYKSWEYFILELKNKRFNFFTVYFNRWTYIKLLSYTRTSHFFWLKYATFSINYAICLIISTIKTIFIKLPLYFIVFVMKQQHLWLVLIIYKLLTYIFNIYNWFAQINYTKIITNYLYIITNNIYPIIIKPLNYIYNLSWFRFILDIKVNKWEAHKWMVNIITSDIYLLQFIAYEYDYVLLIKIIKLLIYKATQDIKNSLYLKENWGTYMIVILTSVFFKTQLWIDNVWLYLQLPLDIRKHGVDYINRATFNLIAILHFARPRRTAIYTHSNWLLWPIHYWYCLNKINVLNISLDILRDFKIATKTPGQYYGYIRGVRIVLRDDKITKAIYSEHYQPIIASYIGKNFTKNIPSIYQGLIVDSLFVYYLSLFSIMLISNGFYKAILGKTKEVEFHMNRQYAWNEFRSEPLQKKKWFMYDRDTAYNYYRYFKFTNSWKIKNEYYPLYLSKISDIAKYDENLWNKLKESSLLKKINRIDAKVWICPLFINYYTLPENNDLRNNYIKDNQNFQLMIAFGYSKDKFIELSWDNENSESYEDFLQETIIEVNQLNENIKKEHAFINMQIKAENFLKETIGQQCTFAFSRDYDNLFQIQGNNKENNETKFIEEESQYGYTPWATIFWLIVCPILLFNKAFLFVSGYNIHHQINTNILALQEHVYTNAIFVNHFVTLRVMRDFTPDLYSIYKNRANIDTPTMSAFRKNYWNRLNDDYSYLQYFFAEGYDGYHTWAVNLYTTPQNDIAISDINLYFNIIKVVLTILLLIYSLIKAKSIKILYAKIEFNKYIKYNNIKSIMKKIKKWYWQ